jgi:hypothetical protein
MGQKRGNIVKILSDKALIINLGTEDDVTLSDIVHIIHTGEEIQNPENEGKSLGRLEYVKAVLRVTHIQETMSTCAPLTVPEKESALSSLYRTVSSDMARVAMEKSPYGEQSEPLDIKSGDIDGMPQIPSISVGDTAVVFRMV